MPEIISRKDARARGLKRYFTGEFCIRGHIAQRQIQNGECLVCSSVKRRGLRKKHSENEKRATKDWKLRHPEKLREYDRKRKLKASIAVRILEEAARNDPKLAKIIGEINDVVT